MVAPYKWRMDAFTHNLSPVIATPVSAPVTATDELILTNARVVTGYEVLSGTVMISGGNIREVAHGACRLPSAVDLEGDFLIPGLIELHTDNLERHASPRPGVQWPSTQAVLAHDVEIAGAGITTVLDSLRLGSVRSFDSGGDISALVAGIERAEREGLTRAEHLLHLRCEVCCAGVSDALSEYITHGLLRLVSVMDHTPGQRQFVDHAKYKQYYGGKYNLNDAEFDLFVAEAELAQARYAVANRRHIVGLCRRHGVALASHDDATGLHVAEAKRDGAVIAEFPTTHDAADACAANGLSVLMGAPNVMRGGSHSGNVAAHELAERGVLDILSSDYVPATLLQAVFKLTEFEGEAGLPRAIAMVSNNAAMAVGLSDRGEIALGKRADLVRVRNTQHAAVVREVWRQGRRVI